MTARIRAFSKTLALRALCVYTRLGPSEKTALLAPSSGRTRILIQSMGGIGNTLMATPLIAATRSVYPEARIDLLTTAGAAAFTATNPHLSEILVDHDKGLVPTYRLIREVRRRNYDAAILALRASVFRFAARTALARVPRRVIHRYGFTRRDNFLPAMTHLVPWDTSKHDVEANLDLLRALSGAELEAGPLELPIPDAYRRSAHEHLVRLGSNPELPTVGLCSGSGPMRYKRWPMEKFLKLARELHAACPDANLLAFCGPDEHDDAETWRTAFPGKEVKIVEGLAPLSYAAALAKCNIVVCNDSLPVHLCSSLQIPMVALFGPTDPALTGPWKCPSVLLQAPVPSGRYSVPYSPDPASYGDCMAHITVEDVLAAVEQLLCGSPPY